MANSGAAPPTPACRGRWCSRKAAARWRGIPSQVYQFLLEGLLLFALLWWQGGRAHRHTGFISGLFLIGYGLTRFIAEYFREPDAHLGLLALGLSMGQWLCVPMVVVGLFLVRRRG
jgi:phosphatidylglycerol---prolipoprotein diacylglyceryl transferase